LTICRKAQMKFLNSQVIEVFPKQDASLRSA